MRKKIFSFFAILFFPALILAGCQESDSGGGNGGGTRFKLTGSYDGPGVSNILPSRFAVINGVTADYVYAVNTSPEYGTDWRKLAPINEDGSFEITLSKGDPWVVAFIDSTQTGSNMIRGILKAGALDSVAPRETESDDTADVGTVSIDETIDAAVVDAANEAIFIGNLGMTTEGAAAFGAIDDLMLRFINPDIDGDGMIDLNQDGFPQWDSTTYWIGYTFNDLATNGTRMRAGQDLLTTGSISFNGANPQISASLDSVYSNYTHFNFYLDEGTGAALLTTQARWGGGELYFDPNNTRFSAPTLGKLPEGKYIYKFYTSLTDAQAEINDALTLTFTHVRTMENVNNPENFVFPFPKFYTDADDTITSIEISWKIYKSGVFESATPEDIEMFMGKNKGEVKWYTTAVSANQNDAMGCYITLSPSSSDYATVYTIAGDSGNWGASASHKRADIRNLAVSFTSKLGLFIKMTVTD